MIKIMDRYVYFRILVFEIKIHSTRLNEELFCMSKEFLRFKRKMRLGVILRALAFGLGLGVLVASGLWLLTKLELLSRPVILCWLLGGIVGVAAFGLVFALSFPSDKRLAKRIDQKLELGEKVQTMVEFREDQSFMVSLQKSSTEEILKNTPYKKIRGKHAWAHCILPVIACGALVATMLIPVGAFVTPEVIEDPAYNLTAWQEQALRDLIKEVQESDMEVSPKEKVVNELSGLLGKMKSINKESEMKAAVLSTIQKVDSIVDGHNTYRIVAEKLMASEHAAVKEMGGYLNDLNSIALSEYLEQLEEDLIADPNAVTSLSSALDAATDGMLVSSADGFFSALEKFHASLGTAASITDATAREEALHTAFSDVIQDLNLPLLCQYANERVGHNTIRRLMEIFGISASELPAGTLPEKDPSEGGDSSFDDGRDDDKNNSGGIGSGDMLYASNDTIYYPDDNIYTEYGKVINEYYAKIAEKIVDGNLSDEMKEILSDYYAILFDGSGNKAD